MRSPRPDRIGILGGTFDPPHLGHLIVAHDAADRLALDRVLLVVAARPPHKSAALSTRPELRLAMVEAAVRGDPRLEASGVELERAGPSYTVDTLRSLRADLPGSELFLLLGADQWRELASWRDPRAIAGLVTVAVMARDGEDPAAVDPGIGVACRPVLVTRIDLSSTDVRARVRHGRSIRHLVPEAVRLIIEREALYASSAVQHA